MAILPVGIGPQEGGYQIERSLRFNSADSAYLSRTPASAGNRKTWTWSGWVKKAQVSGASGVTLFSAGTTSGSTTTFNILFTAADKIALSASATNFRLTTAVYRDPSSWYHIVASIDTTQATADDRVKLYVNGVQVTAFDTTNNPSQDADTGVNNTEAHNIGRRVFTSDLYLNGYLTDVHFIDGSALDPTSFGEYNTDTGVWQPKAYTGSYGTNGFYLDFADNSSTTALGYDAAGSNDWTPNNFSVTAGAGNDSLVDTPTRYGTDTGAGGEVRGNYCTLNPLVTVGSTSHPTFSEGNLKVAFANYGYAGPLSTLALPPQNTYCEITCAAVGSAGNSGVGIAQIDADLSGNMIPTKCVTYGANGNKTVSASFSSYGSSFTTGDIIGIAYNYSSNEVTFYKNNVSQGALSLSSLSGSLFFCCHATSGAITWEANFGQRPFAYTAPSGFKALCTTNLPEPTIADGGLYMNPVLYTGNGSTQSITGVGFQPDLVWIKIRNQAYDHTLVDAVRGTSKDLESSSTDAEQTRSTVTAFGSDGFTVGTDSQVNSNGNTFVSWNWKANGSGVSNTDGTITSTVSANTTSGFSIVTYTGTGSAATVGHGLGVAPSLVIVKNRTSAVGWGVMAQAANSGSGHLGRLLLNETASWASTSEYWNNTAPTSSVFSVGTNSITNASGGTFVAYCFAPVAGYSAFGSYTGNGSSDGPFVFTGFRPKYFLVKSTSATGHWELRDTSRDLYNGSTQRLFPNYSNAEDTGDAWDLLANGVKLRTTHSSVNASGVSYIYAAFAEVPFSLALGR